MADEMIIKGEKDKHKKLILGVSTDVCVLSTLNTRQNPPKDAVDMLVERINKFVFETTRALWAVKNNNVYEVFAGGLRLEGAKKAKSDVAILEYIGYSDDEIVALSDKDNEDDEYHVKVSPVEVWASYARLRDAGWKQERIADAKGVKQSIISKRLMLHDELPNEVKQNIRQGLIDEGHLLEIMQLFVNEYLSHWLTTEEARQELIDKTMVHIRKSGVKSTKAVRKDVNSIKTLINKVDEMYTSFKKPEILYQFVETSEGNVPRKIKYDARKDFLRMLKENTVRTQTDVAFYCSQIKEKIADSLKKYKEYITGESDAADEETERQKKLAEIRNKFLNTNGLKALEKLKDGTIKLILVDPPYGMNYQSNRRWKSEKKEKIKGDTPEEALSLVDKLLKTSKKKLMDDAHLLIFTNSKQLCNIRNLFIKNEYNLKGELIWVKEEHGTGDIKGTFAPQHEYIVHATKGKPDVFPRKPTVFKVAREHGANPKDHPTEKPVELLKKLIESTTGKGELVVDTFAGTASTLVATYELERDYWGCEIDKEFWEKGIDLFVDDVPTGERLRGAYTEKGKDLCVLNDITIRTHTKDGKKLEMYTSEADDFVYAIENYEKNGICRAYRADMQGIKEHYLKRHFSCREIQNVDGNYFVPINIDELDKYGLVRARCIPIGDNNVKPKKDETLADWF